MAAELPGGVLSVVNGGADVGETLVSDPRVAKITFTGACRPPRRSPRPPPGT
ncbi:aldehyde dehydrogenase family protein [Salmonella enterica]|uniref:aldehyde dehydrogenase family protein n=1 Tax=Salmonella enterica TaxID=28901 RepID=UPI003CEC0C8A